MSSKTHQSSRKGHHWRPLLVSRSTGYYEPCRSPVVSNNDNNKPLSHGFDELDTLNSRISDNYTKHSQICNHNRHREQKAFNTKDITRLEQLGFEDESVEFKNNIKLAKIMRPDKRALGRSKARCSLWSWCLLVALVSLSSGLLRNSHCLEEQLNPATNHSQESIVVQTKNLGNNQTNLTTLNYGGANLILIARNGQLVSNHTSAPIKQNFGQPAAGGSIRQAEAGAGIHNGLIIASLEPNEASPLQSDGSSIQSTYKDLASRELEQVAATKPVETMVTSASKKKKKMMKKKKKMEKKHKEWKKGKKHKKKKYESKKKKGGMEKKKKGKKEKKKWGMEKKGHKKKGNFKKKKWGMKKKMKKGQKKGKKGHKMLKDKGHKKKGFKKVYHKEEYGKKKKWHDIKREKKWNTKQKKWKKKWKQEKGKKYKGKHMKKYHKKNKHGKKYKKEKKSKWKKHKGEKFKKGHKKKKEEYAKKKEGGKKKKMKKMKKEMKKKKG